MRTKLFLGLTLLGILWIFGGEAPRPAQACSGGGGTIEWLITEEHATVVLGHFIEIDNIQRNALFEVSQYLAGSGDAKILNLYAVSSELAAAISQGADTGCSSVGDPVAEELDVILFLERKGDGSYWYSSLHIYDFPSDESTQEVAIRYEDSTQEWTIEDLTLDEMVRVISDITGEAPHEPNPESQQPFLAPLLFMTDQDSAYLLPVDGEDPVLLAQDVDYYQASGRRIMFIQDDTIHVVYNGTPTVPGTNPASTRKSLIDCPQQDCASISSQGIYTANFIPGGAMVFNVFTGYIPSADTTPDDWTIYSIEGPVYGYQFSPADNLLAVWRESSIDIYLLSFTDVQRFFLTHHNVMQTSKGPMPGGIWSADERRLAFTDADGLWLWDVRTDVRQLLVETTDELPIATSFSHYGNYLHIQMGAEMFYLDIATGERHPSGFMSPDERWLAVPTSDNDPRGSFCDLIRDECSGANWPFTDLYWIDDDEAVVWAFWDGIGLPATRRLYRGSPAIFDHYNEFCRFASVPIPEPDEVLPWYNGIAFDYEPTSQMIVVQNDSHTISVGYQLISWKNADQYNPRNLDLTQDVCDDYVTFDLVGKIDGEIVSVEWLPSIFIEE